MNNAQRQALAALLGEDGFAVTRAEVEALVAEIREDVALGVLPEMPECVEDLSTPDAYLHEAVNAIYSRTADQAVCARYRDGILDALNLMLEGRLVFRDDGRYWEDVEEEVGGPE